MKILENPEKSQLKKALLPLPGTNPSEDVIIEMRADAVMKMDLAMNTKVSTNGNISVALKQDGKTLEVKENGVVIQKFEGSTLVKCFALSSDGQFLVVGYKNFGEGESSHGFEEFVGGVKVWNLANNIEYSVGSKKVNNMFFLPNTHLLGIGNIDGSIMILDMGHYMVNKKMLMARFPKNGARIYDFLVRKKAIKTATLKKEIIDAEGKIAWVELTKKLHETGLGYEVGTDRFRLTADFEIEHSRLTELFGQKAAIVEEILQQNLKEAELGGGIWILEDCHEILKKIFLKKRMVF